MSINLVKGYGKVSDIPADDPTSYNNHHHHKLAANKHRKTTVISLLVFLFLLISAAVAVVIYKSTADHKSPKSTTTQSTPSQSLSINRTESTRIVCSVTQYPNSCISAISSLDNFPTKPDPELIFILSLQISLSELKNTTSIPKTLISKSNDPQTVSALRDCATLFDDAVTQLNNSVSLMVDGTGEKVLTAEKIADVSSWISGGMTDQETCLDGLEEMESTAIDEVKRKVQKSKECMSNSLAILANINSLLLKFGQPMH